MFFIGKFLVAAGATDFTVRGVGIFRFWYMQRQHISVLKRLLPLSGVAFHALGITFNTRGGAFDAWLAAYACYGGRNEQHRAKYHEGYEKGSGSW
jgi:hypothetical protein